MGNAFVVFRGGDYVRETPLLTFLLHLWDVCFLSLKRVTPHWTRHSLLFLFQVRDLVLDWSWVMWPTVTRLRYFPVAPIGRSPRVHLHVMGMLRFMFGINQPSLPTPFDSVLTSISVSPINCISFHKFSRQLSVLSLCSCGLSSALLALSTMYLSMKVSFSPDIFHSGWLGSKTPIN